MKRSLFSKSINQTLLAVPAAALMLGAAHAQSTVGLNFQTWYYDSGNNPQTIGWMGTGYSAYNATGFPVTAKAFGVSPANWFNTDPIYGNSNGGGNPINQAGTFGGASTNFAGSLSCFVNSPLGGFQSGSGCMLKSGLSTWPSYAPGVFCPQGNDEALWGIIVGNDANPFSVSISGLAAKFPHGYVIQSMAAVGNISSTILPSVDFTDGTTTNTAAYHTWVINNSPGAQWPETTAGVSDSSGVFTADTIYFNSRSDGTGNKSSLAGVIITDQPVVSLDPASGSYIANQAVNLSAGAIGIPPLGYQWRSNGIPIPGATTPSLAVPSNAAGVFNFDVVVTNLYGGATSAIATITVAVPLTLTWDADSLTTGAQDGSGTWDNGTIASWWNGSGDVVWPSLGNAVFGAGGTSAYIVTVTNNVTVSGLTFNSGNYTLAGTNITLAGVPQIVANTNATVGVILSGSSGLTKNGSGKIILTGNNNFSGDLVVNSGSLLGGTSGGNSYLGAVNGSRTITIASGASITVSNNNVFGGGGHAAAGLPAVVINGGTFNSTRYNSIGNVTLNSGGTLSQSASDSGSYQGYQFLGSITAGGTSASTISTGNGRANHLLGGGTNVFNVADATGDASPDLIVSTPLVNGSGDYSGTGSLVKSGTGTLLLAGVNTYTGPTIVSNGTLTVSGQLTGSGDVVLNDATAFNVVAGSVNSVIPSAANLILGNSGTSTNALGFVGLNNPAVATIVVSSLNVVNPVKVNITGTVVSTGLYPLIQYGGETGAGAITLGTLPSGVSATLVDDHISSVSLNVTATPVQTEVWNGTPSGVWDINTTANWLIGSSAAKYQEANILSFDDTASGTTAITLNTSVHPTSVTFNNAIKNYTISGTGAIAGGTSLILSGSGTLALNNTNSYAGGTTINAGTLAISTDVSLGAGGLTMNGGALAITGTTAFTSGKNIILNGSSTVQVNDLAGASLTSPITGGGLLTKSGNGTLTFGVQQTYTGGTIINGGILDLTGGGGSAGTIRGAVTVNAGGTLRLSTGDAIGYTSGANNLSYIDLEGGTLTVNSTANQTLGSATVIMNGGTINGVSAGNIDFFGGDSSLTTYASATPSTISGMTLSPLRQGNTTFSVAAGTTPNGIDLDISSVLKTSGTDSGAVLAKADFGTMRLSAVNTYQGGTEVQGGKLILTGRLIGGGSVTVDDYYDNTTLNVSAGASPAILATTNNLTLGVGGTSTMNLGFANIYSPTVPIISVFNVVINGTVTVNINGNITIGQFPLIKYAGTKTGAGALTLGSLPNGVGATLVDNVANSSVDLKVTSAPLSIITDISSGTNYAYAGVNYKLTVIAGGSPTLGYQWYKDGTPLAGATASTLALTQLTAGDNGGYYTIVTNASGSISSSTNHLVVLPDSGYMALVIGAGPIAFWPLNETNGTTALDVWGGNNASYSGTYALDYAVNPQTGTPGAHFDGASGVALTPYVPALNPNVFTAEAWVNPDNVPASEYCPLSCGQFASTGRSGWLIYQFPGYWDLRTYYGVGTSLGAEAIGTTAPVIGAWTHLAVSWDGTTAKLYVNGVLQGTGVSAGNPAYLPGASGGFCAGARADNAFFFPGTVSDAALYDRVLTPTEIQSHASYTKASLITVTRSGANLILTWTSGSLQAAPAVTGTYTNVPAAVSPYTVTPTEAQEFFRLVN